MSNSFDDLLSKLYLHDLITPLARAEGEIEYIKKFQLNEAYIDANKEEQIKNLMKEMNLKSNEELANWRKQRKLNNEKDFIAYVEYRIKRTLVIEHILKNVGESLFLRYKDRLDRVLYSLIRVDNEDLANKIYYEIEANEIEFGDAAQLHSCGPESKTQGIVGPVDLTTPHPEIAARLRTASARQLFAPFKADEWHLILRLEYRFDSEYNESTRKFLGGLLLGSKSTDLVKGIADQYWDHLE